VLRVKRKIRDWFGLLTVRTGGSVCAAGRVGRIARHALGLALLLALPGGAQNPVSSQDSLFEPRAGQHVGNSIDPAWNSDPVEMEKRLRALNAERQKSLVADTNKLLKLAQELQDEIGHTSPDALTPTQLRKVADIEKLAHSIKEKMSTSVRGVPDGRMPFPAVVR